MINNVIIELHHFKIISIFYFKYDAISLATPVNDTAYYVHIVLNW